VDSKLFCEKSDFESVNIDITAGIKKVLRNEIFKIYKKNDFILTPLIGVPYNTFKFNPILKVAVKWSVFDSYPLLSYRVPLS
jgi:hypothetical protein